VEAGLSIYLENFATSLGSREQLAIAEFADALLVLPKTLAVNAAKVRQAEGLAVAWYPTGWALATCSCLLSWHARNCNRVLCGVAQPCFWSKHATCTCQDDQPFCIVVLHHTHPSCCCPLHAHT
jgi:hypothetical protein